MTQTNQIQKSDDFKIAIILKIEGRNSRTLILHFVGIAAALVALGVKVTMWLMGRAS